MRTAKPTIVRRRYKVLPDLFPGLKKPNSRPTPRSLFISRQTHDAIDAGRVTQLRIMLARGVPTTKRIYPSFEVFPAGVVLWSEHEHLDNVYRARMYVVTDCRFQFMYEAGDEDFRKEGFVGYEDWRNMQMTLPTMGDTFDQTRRCEIIGIRRYDPLHDRQEVLEEIAFRNFGGLLDGGDVEMSRPMRRRNDRFVRR